MREERNETKEKEPDEEKKEHGMLMEADGAGLLTLQ